MTSMCEGVASGYSDAMAVRSSGVPFVCVYPSSWDNTARRSASVSASSSTRSGWMPLSDRFQATLFSHVDCIRSIANGSSLMAAEVYPEKNLGYPVASPDQP